MKKNIVLLEIILLFLLSLIVFNICGCGTNPTSDGTHASKWNVSDVSNVTGGSNSLALDHNGNPKLSISEGATLLFTPNRVSYVYWNGSAWVQSTVISGADVCFYTYSTSIVLASDDSPRISFIRRANPSSGFLCFASQESGSWNISTIESGNTYGTNSLALDSNGNPHISYYDATNKVLKYTTLEGSTWITTVADNAGDVGQYCSLVLDGNGKPHISYYDATNKDLKYATLEGSTWITTVVDSSGEVGGYCSLALDNNGLPHISYYDATNKDLKYATLEGSAWVNTVVDSVEDVGSYCSLALDSNGFPHISYFYDRGFVGDPSVYRGSLKYAVLKGLNWEISVIDDGNDLGTGTRIAGKYTSIKINNNGKACISYYLENDVGNGIRYARKL